MVKPGIYILTYQGRVVHVGRSKCMLTTIADHRSVYTGKDKLPSWFPIRHVTFDDFIIHPMPYNEAEDLVGELLHFYKPRHHHYRPPELVTQPTITRRA